MDKFIYVVCGLAAGISVKKIDHDVSFEEIKRDIGGYVEHVGFGSFSVLCDEDGRVKGLPSTCTIRGIPFCGTVYVGVLTDDGMAPMPSDIFDRWCILV